jgi:hypothetical protein
MTDRTRERTDQEWSVLTKAVGSPSSPAPSDEQTRGLLARLPGGDKWIQYPPASGRGHAFETRFWVTAADASAAAELGTAMVMEAGSEVGLADWSVVRVHAASVEERGIEYYPGLEGRRRGAADWSVMHRSLRPADEQPFDEGTRVRFVEALGGHDCVVSASGRMVELRFWVSGADAVEAAATADALVVGLLESLGRTGWSTIRVQTASPAERLREIYLGVERRLDAIRDG